MNKRELILADWAPESGRGSPGRTLSWPDINRMADELWFSVKLCDDLCLCGEITSKKRSPQSHRDYTENHRGGFPSCQFHTAHGLKE